MSCAMLGQVGPEARSPIETPADTCAPNWMVYERGLSSRDGGGQILYKIIIIIISRS